MFSPGSATTPTAPVTRGSAATGYVAVHALLLAIGVPAGVLLGAPDGGGVGGLRPPVGIQMDWEAILTPTPGAFVRAAWLAWAAPVVAAADRERARQLQGSAELGVITRAIHDSDSMVEWTFRRMLKCMS